MQRKRKKTLGYRGCPYPPLSPCSRYPVKRLWGGIHVKDNNVPLLDNRGNLPNVKTRRKEKKKEKKRKEMEKKKKQTR